MKGKKAFITGVKGMAGSHLADYLLHGGAEVIGIDLPEPSSENIESAIFNGLKYEDCDVRDTSKLMSLLNGSHSPDWVFHLAATAFVPLSWKTPVDCVNNNVGGAASILESVRLACPEAVVQLACSSEEYGMVYTEEIPIDPNRQPFRPMSTYGVSKVATGLLAQQYTRSYGLRTVLTRTFNHTGPRQADDYVVSSFIKDAVLIKSGKKNRIYHGDLDTVRDFTDVRDIVRAYVMAVSWAEQTCTKGKVLQIGGAAVFGIRDILKQVCELTGLQVGIHTERREDRLRPSDVPVLVCDSSIFRQMTGWAPTIPFHQTLRDMYDYWYAKSGPNQK